MEFQLPEDVQRLSKGAGKSDHTVYGTTSLICGIISFLLIWTSPVFAIFIPLPEGCNVYNTPSLGYVTIIRYLTPNFAAATLAVIFGVLAYWIKKPKDTCGKIGFTLGLFVILIGIIQYVVYTFVS